MLYVFWNALWLNKCIFRVLENVSCHSMQKWYLLTMDVLDWLEMKLQVLRGKVMCCKSFTWFDRECTWMNMFSLRAYLNDCDWPEGTLEIYEWWNGRTRPHLCMTFELLMNSRWNYCAREYRMALTVPAVWISNSGLLVNLTLV